MPCDMLTTLSYPLIKPSVEPPRWDQRVFSSLRTFPRTTTTTTSASTVSPLRRAKESGWKPIAFHCRMVTISRYKLTHTCKYTTQFFQTRGKQIPKCIIYNSHNTHAGLQSSARSCLYAKLCALTCVCWDRLLLVRAIFTLHSSNNCIMDKAVVIKSVIVVVAGGF